REIVTAHLKWLAAHGRRTAASQRDIGAKLRRRGRSLRAFSTIGRENGPGIQTHRSWMGPERYELNPPIAPLATLQLVRTLTPKSTRGRLVSICALIQRT